MSKNPNHPAASPEAIAKRKATMLVKRQAKEQSRGYPMPLILKCKVTGHEVRYTVPKYIEKCIAKAGSLQALQDSYVSREGKKILESQGTPNTGSPDAS
jgi:hypothetical protein